MARITVERPHALGKDKAREKAELLAEKLGDKYGIEHTWNGDIVSLEGKGAKGTVEVEDASGAGQHRTEFLPLGDEQHDSVRDRASAG
jgi:putative polyhydroxyalkanoate system protein